MDCCCCLIEELQMAASFSESAGSAVTFEQTKTVAITRINQGYCWFILIIRTFDFLQVKQIAQLDFVAAVITIAKSLLSLILQLLLSQPANQEGSADFIAATQQVVKELRNYLTLMKHYFFEY